MLVVLKSKFEKLVSEYNALYRERDEWRDLYYEMYRDRDRYAAMAAQRQEQFTDEDLRRLLQLCHPDKHCGKQMAQDMTAKIQAMRKSK